ncbi:MAG: hypothetical protein P4L76_12980 [Beijerinckiaceae bacterium]|nr:hypothetical protein [Beijerinckiaceae bacterium]
MTGLLASEAHEGIHRPMPLSARDRGLRSELATDIARQGTALCKGAIARLAGESPRWKMLLGQVDALRKTLTTGDMIAAHWDLTLVSDDVRSIGLGLVAEGKSLRALIGQNILLSQRIEQVADDVRFLAAIVSHAKVEMASLDDNGEALGSFGQALEALAIKAKATLQEYRSKHAILLVLIRNTATVQSAFEQTQKSRLMNLAEDLEASASELSALRILVEAAAVDLDVASQLIRDEIEQSLMLAQEALAASQRVGNVGAALPVAPDLAAGQHAQADDARAELRTTVHAIVVRLDRVSSAAQQLAAKSPDPSKSQGDPANSFLDKLGPKLQEARLLINECRQSRTAVESIADKVIPTFEALNCLADRVTIMVTDITISGTNALVKSHRLGQQGAGLSIIAQHLRSHALRVADGIISLAPLLASARVANREFMQATEDQDTAHLTEIASRMTSVVESFTVVDTFTMKVMKLVREEAASLSTKVPAMIDDFRKIADMEQQLPNASDAMEPALAPRFGDAHGASGASLGN